MEAFNEFVYATRKRKRAEKEMLKYVAQSKAAWQRMQELGELDHFGAMMNSSRGKK